jgi:acyl-CoA-binding protein
MDVNIDKVFVQAVATIKSLTDLSKSSNLPRPSISDRLNLYGLYNQSTRGDPSTIDLSNANNSTELKKYNSWLKFKGLTKVQARKQYTKYLLNILKNNYSIEEYPSIIPLKNDLQDAWDCLENIDLSLSLNKKANSDLLTTSNYISNNINNIPPRSHSPAASLYRIASSGINANIIRPPSRNQSISKSRHNSFSGSLQNTNSQNLITMNNSQSQSQSQSNNYNYNNSNSLNTNAVNSIEFLKWQGEINNTLLKISTELSNLKYQQNLGMANDAGHRSISGSTTVSVQSEIQDYKLRYNNSDFNDKISNIRSYSLANTKYEKANNDNNNKKKKKQINKDTINWIYTKLKMLVKFLKDKFYIKIRIGSVVKNFITTLIAFLFLGLFKKVVDVYLKQRFNLKLEAVLQSNNRIKYISQWFLFLFKGRVPDNRDIKSA